MVKATKVKFYMNGDTVVYDASAFRLAEGSMLDKLIEKLPGVEIKDDGRIFAKGKFVTSLLLNGEEFFGNNSKVLLENLPAMTVDKVKVYHKKDKFNEAMQLKADEGNLVMDVRLKKNIPPGMSETWKEDTGQTIATWDVSSPPASRLSHGSRFSPT